MNRSRGGTVDAIVLAGGRGTRLRAAVPYLPKPLAPVGGRPFLDLLLEELARAGGVRRVVLAVGFRAGLFVKRYAGARQFGFPVVCSVEERPLGTGGALRLALRRTASRNVLVANGDSLVRLNVSRLVALHRRRRARLTLAVTRVPDASRYGTVGVDRRTMTATAFLEKAPGRRPGFINAGRYVFARAVAAGIPGGRPVSLEREVLPRLLPGSPVLVASGGFIDIGTPRSYAAARATARA